MNDREKSIEMYTTPGGIKKYTEAVTKIGLWKSEKKIILKYISKSSKILDLGCGAGRTTFGLYDLGYKKIIGLDLAAPLIKFAQNHAYSNNYNIEFIVGDSTQLPFSSNSFDFVFYSFNGLFLIPKSKNRIKALKEIYRVLKKGGYLIYSAHDRNSTEEYKKFWDLEYEKWKQTKEKASLEFGDMIPEENGGKGFIHYASIEEMKTFIKNTKFEIVEIISRDNLAKENKKVKEFSSDTNFWVLRKY